MSELRRQIFNTLELDPGNSRVRRIIDFFLIALIVLNIFAVVIETVESLPEASRIWFHVFDLFSVGVFTIEYIVRIWSCIADPNYKHPLFGRLRYAAKPMTVIDLVAILPFYLHLMLPVDLRILRVLRLLRLLRVFKLGRYSDALQTVGRVLRSRKEEILMTLYVGAILLILASGLLYAVEHEAQPEVFSDIPAALWWGVTTLTTVGYGDIIPITLLGKIITAFISLLGIGIFALPAGILASGFAEDVKNKRKQNKVCPHCGQKLGPDSREI